MNDIIEFTLHSGLNAVELCQLRWADNDEKTRTGALPRFDRRSPDSVIYRRFKYTPEAWEIVQRQPRQDPRIFPYVGGSIAGGYREACALLHIKDLQFMDLRFEGVCRLFERGLLLHEVAEHTQVSSLATLRKYEKFLFGRPRDTHGSESPRLLAPRIDQLR
jgi:integrase